MAGSHPQVGPPSLFLSPPCQAQRQHCRRCPPGPGRSAPHPIGTPPSGDGLPFHPGSQAGGAQRSGLRAAVARSPGCPPYFGRPCARIGRAERAQPRVAGRAGGGHASAGVLCGRGAGERRHRPAPAPGEDVGKLEQDNWEGVAMCEGCGEPWNLAFDQD